MLIVLAAPTEEPDLIGKPLDSVPLMSAISGTALGSRGEQGSLSFRSADGSNRVLTFAKISGTGARLIASIDEDMVTAAINRTSAAPICGSALSSCSSCSARCSPRKS